MPEQRRAHRVRRRREEREGTHPVSERVSYHPDVVCLGSERGTTNIAVSLLEGRRRFIGAALTLVAFARSAWAQTTGGAPIRYAPLSRPVRIPLDSVAAPWNPVSFVAEAMAQ